MDDDFDEKQFNLEFEKNMELDKIRQDKLRKEKLRELSGLHGEKRLYDYSIFETLINMKDAVFDILDDVICFNIDLKIFTKNNRMYYIGIILIIILVLIQLCENIII